MAKRKRKTKVDCLDLCKSDIPYLKELIKDLELHDNVATPIRSVYDDCYQEWELADDWAGTKNYFNKE